MYEKNVFEDWVLTLDPMDGASIKPGRLVVINVISVR